VANVVPIRGLRYNPGVADFTDLVTPPYDVIDAAGQDRYYRKHPRNIIRLEYGLEYPGDNNENNRYTRAAGYFTDWRHKGILVRDEQPALYLYRQEFSVRDTHLVRSGFICGVRLEPYENGVVLPHEETLPKHKADRLALMQACRANFSPIFSLFADPEMAVERLLAGAAPGEPDAGFTDEDGQIHRLWVINDPGVIAGVQTAMTGKTIFIADGHHRYETALNYSLERRKEDPNPASDRPYNFVMMTLVNLYDPGLVVLPTHRLVKNITRKEQDELLEKLETEFAIETFPLDDHGVVLQSVLELMALRAGLPGPVSSRDITKNKTGVNSQPPRHKHVFGLYAGEDLLHLLTLKHGVDLSNLMPRDKSAAWRGLDVSVLHRLILERHLGIGSEQLSSGANLAYTRDEKEAIGGVNRGDYQLSLLMNPTLVEEVMAVAGNGEKMPQKSTFFYPKLITGLVINKLS
jgi:uncharacterized protein (DUF1015 family)